MLITLEGVIPLSSRRANTGGHQSLFGGHREADDSAFPREQAPQLHRAHENNRPEMTRVFRSARLSILRLSLRTTEIGLVFQGKTAVTRLSDQLSSEQGVALPRVGIFRLSAWGKKTNGCPTRWRRQRTLRRRKHGRLTATPALKWRRHATRHMTRHHRCITTPP